MRLGTASDLPRDRQADYRRARTLTWISIVFISIAVVLVYLTLGSSQAMKAAWVEDLVSLIPAISFLIAARYVDRVPDRTHPYGYHRAVNIAYLFSSIVLLGMGLYILFESLMTLISQEHPTIGTVELFGNIVWLGWLMIAVLAFTIVPAVVLGRLQIPLARRLHDKALFANAEMLKADWGTAIAGIAGIVGIGLGIWWADAAAAIAISLDIAHDGWSNSRTAVREMADGEATLVDGKAVDPLRSRLETELGGLAWVDTAYVRVRSEGHVFFADCYVVPNRDSVRPQEVEVGIATLKALDWRLHEVSLTPVSDMEVEFAPRVSS